MSTRLSLFEIEELPNFSDEARDQDSDLEINDRSPFS
jgi:hypothetical protein